MTANVEDRARTARAIEVATNVIAEIRHALGGYEAAGMWDLHAEQSRELGWWETHLRELQAQRDDDAGQLPTAA